MLDAIDQYRKELSCVAEFAPSTVDNYVSCIGAFCDFTKTTLQSDPLKCHGPHLLAWLEKMKQTGISQNRLGHHQYAMKSFFAFLCKLKILDRNPAEDLPPLRKNRSEKNKPVSEAIVFKLLGQVVRTDWLGRRNHLIISMLWCLGLRVSELTGLTVGSFEPDHDPKNKIGLLRIRGKNKKQRALFVVDRLYDDLRAYLADPESPGKKHQPLFNTQPDKAISTCRVQKMIQEYVKKAGIKERIAPHVLRHTFATEMYHRGVPLSAIRTMMGHEKIAETAVYVHVSDQMKKMALEHISISGGDLWQ